MKIRLTVLLMLCLSLFLSGSALAVDDYIINETSQSMAEFFSNAELEELNARAAAFREKEGVAPYFVLADDTMGMTTGDYSEWYYLEHDFIPVDAIVMIANIKTWETQVYADGGICLDTLVVVLILRAQLKTVRAQRGAADYNRPGSMQVTSSYERFLYRTVNRTPRPKDNDSGSGGGGGVKTGGGLRSN